jgi:hypothetical protein
MRLRLVGAIVVTAVALFSSGWSSSASAGSEPSSGTTCTWGGTPATPTGTFSIKPGLTNEPLASPAVFKVTGELVGDPGCNGTLTYDGQVDPGGTCLQNTFQGKAKGIPDVVRFVGDGAGPLGPARLYDKDGNVVGSENANVTTVDNVPHFLDCSTPEGFTGGTFSSVIVLFGD